MVHRNLQAFGQRLRHLRQNAGLSQEGLAGRMSQIHAKITEDADLRVDGNRISKWERAFQDKQGRIWKPTRQQTLYLIEAFADQLGPEMSHNWALQAGYRLNNDDLKSIFSEPLDVLTSYLPASPDMHTNLKRLSLPVDQVLFGIDLPCHDLHQVLNVISAPWLIAIDGIGGIGKTALVGKLVHDLIGTNRFYDIAWVSAKQEEYFASQGLRLIDQSVMNRNTLVDSLLEQLGKDIPPLTSFEEKLTVLLGLLKRQSYLIIIDNLETVADYEVILPLLRKLADPTKFLLTSRHSLSAYSDIYCLSLPELPQADVYYFIEHEAKIRGISTLVEASQAQLELIFNVVGGNPLALKLVIGQIQLFPLSTVLLSLQKAVGKKISDLYTYIYWQAWKSLDPSAREIFLVMPLAQGGSLQQLVSLSDLENSELIHALEKLINLSLIEVTGDLEYRRYHIHRLTETFLLTEVAQWQLTL